MKNKSMVVFAITLVMLLLFAVGISFAYFAASKDAKISYNLSVSNGDEITFNISASSNLTLNVNPNNPESNSVIASVSSSSDYAYLKNDSNIKNLTCTYDIYYTPTATFTNSAGNTTNQKELTLKGVDSSGQNTSFEFNLNGVSTKTKMATASIRTTESNLIVTQNWTFTLTHYNLNTNQNSLIGSSFGGTIEFETVGCSETV